MDKVHLAFLRCNTLYICILAFHYQLFKHCTLRLYHEVNLYIFSDVKCGLLHCVDGEAAPILTEKETFLSTRFKEQGQQFQCKYVTK